MYFGIRSELTLIALLRTSGGHGHAETHCRAYGPRPEADVSSFVSKNAVTNSETLYVPEDYQLL